MIGVKTYMILMMVFQNELQEWKQVEKNGMVVRWAIQQDRLHFEMTAPTRGWVAVGLNTKDQLEGTNLIMGAVEEEFYRIDDRYIVAPGNHRSMGELGSTDQIRNRYGKEDQTHTVVQFTIPTAAVDHYHQTLVAGKPYFLLMAYSAEDDFDHHSIMRTTIKINL